MPADYANTRMRGVLMPRVEMPCFDIDASPRRRRLRYAAVATPHYDI